MGDEAPKHWLLKTEPECWSWENQRDNSGLSVWDGVRNLQAQKLMKSMSTGDLCFFYHTGKLRQVEGIVRVVKTFYPDPTDDSEKWGAVDVQEVKAFKRPVTLTQMKDDELFKGFLMLRQPRLSVVPVDEKIWARVCELGEEDEIPEAQVLSEGDKKGGSQKRKKSNVELDEKEAGNIEKRRPRRNAKPVTPETEVLVVATEKVAGRRSKRR